MDFTQLHTNLNNVIENLDSIVIDLVSEHNPSLTELNTNQLWEGKGSDDKNLSPKYSEDPYFKSAESAQRYADWKWKISPSSRNKDVPNLYIDGTFYKSIDFKKGEKEIDFYSKTSHGNNVVAKFPEALGLNKTTMIEVNKNVLPNLINKLKYDLGIG